MIYGYARISDKKQNLLLQLEALKNAGCQSIIQEEKSVLQERPKLEKLLKKLKQGDSLIVWKLDRLGREMFQLVTTIADLESKGIIFISLTENIDTTTPLGKLMIALASYFSEMERNIIEERRKAGIAAARKYGRLGGRPKGMSKQTMDKAETAIKMYHTKNEKGEYEFSVRNICKALNIGVATFYRLLRDKNIELKRDF